MYSISAKQHINTVPAVSVVSLDSSESTNLNSLDLKVLTTVPSNGNFN